MAMSKEERYRLWEEELKQPYLPGLTRGQYLALPRREQCHELQKLSQRVTSDMGFWKTCNLSPCRRARACRSFLTEEQYKGEERWHDAFPPCVGPKGARHAEVMRYIRQLADAAEQDDGPKYEGRKTVDGKREW